MTKKKQGNRKTDKETQSKKQKDKTIQKRPTKKKEKQMERTISKFHLQFHLHSLLCTLTFGVFIQVYTFAIVFNESTLFSLLEKLYMIKLLLQKDNDKEKTSHTDREKVRKFS